MTAAECLDLAAEYQPFEQAGELLFNTFDFKVATAWEANGAAVKPWYTEKELAFLNRDWRTTTPQGWEVKLSPCVDAPSEILLAEWRLRRAR